MRRCRLLCRNQGIYLDEYIQVTKHKLFHEGDSCRIETSPLICSANQYTDFYTIGTSLMKELRRSSPIILRKSVLTCRKAEITFFGFFFFCLGFLSQIFTIHRAAGEGGSYLFIFFLPLHPLHRHLDIGRVIVAESFEDCIGFYNSHYCSSYFKISTR